MSPRSRGLVALVVFAAGSAFQITARGDVVAYWRFEDGSGIATDETGRFHGELTDFYTSNGDTGPEGWSTNVMAPSVPLSGASNTGSIRFGGATAFVDVSNYEHMLLGTDFTVEFLMNPDEPVGGSPVFGLSPIDRLYGGLGAYAGTGDLFWRLQFQDEFSVGAADMVQVGEWQHVAFVFAATEYTIYIDGQVQHVGGIPLAGQGSYDFPGTGVTGDRTIGDGFRGYLDEFRISDTALTPDQFLNAVPEPGTLGLLALGGLALLARRTSHRWKS